MNRKFLAWLLAECVLLGSASAQLAVDSVITTRLADPRSVTVFDDNVYIADSGSHRILKYAPDTGLLTAIAGVSGRSGTNDGPGFLARFFSPKGVVRAPGGVIVADSGNHTLRFVDLTSSIPLVTNLVGKTGLRGLASNEVTLNGVAFGVPAEEGTFNTPIGLASDSDGNVFIADSKNNAVRVFTRIPETVFPGTGAPVGNANRLITISTNFLEPAAVAVGEKFGPGGRYLELFVADTRNHAIKLLGYDLTNRVLHTNRLSFNASNVVLLAGSATRVSGTNDSLFAETALFNLPSALHWSGPNVGLIVTDSGNHTLRRVFLDPIFRNPIFLNTNIVSTEVTNVLRFFPKWTPDFTYAAITNLLANQFSVETYVGVPGTVGFQDGPAQFARFSSPVGLVRDPDGDLLVADSGNNALRRVQITPKLPRVSDPKIGYVTFVIDKDTGALLSKLVPITDATFNNDLTIAILAEARTETFFTSGSTPGLFGTDTIPIPNSLNSQPAPPYSDGLPPAQVKPTLLEPRPDVTIKAISTAQSRRPSDVVQARVQFKVATPVILGDNPASFVLTNETAGAAMWYTLDGSAPTNESPSFQAVSDTLSLKVTNAVTFRARAFRRNYKPSEITTKVFQQTDFQANRISFGFERSEASSQFLGSAGQTFIAPVTLSVLPNQKIYSLQFNLTVTNLAGAASLTPGAYSFRSMLTETVFEASQGVTFERIIPPKMFDHFNQQIFTNGTPQGLIISTNLIPVYRDAVVSNPGQSLLGVGWFEAIGRTNLFDSRSHDLISSSIAHDKKFSSAEGRAVLGGYSFVIPAAAANGSEYRIQVGRPSATDLLSRDVFVDAPKDGPSSGTGINSIKNVKIVAGGTGPGQLHYVVGDVAPFRWFNAGDFGDTNILNNDVYQVFQAATYGFNAPPPGTDFFDSMDSCCNGSGGLLVTTNVFDGGLTSIDQIALGDGGLNVTDVFVTFRRSLDPSLKWFARYWVNGQRQAAEVQNLFRGSLNLKRRESVQPLANRPTDTLRAASAGRKPSLLIRADDQRVTPGQIVHVPVQVDVAGDHPVRVLMFNITVEPLDGSPPITEPVTFTSVPQLGLPALTDSKSRANFSAAWLDLTVSGLRGTAEAGALRVAIPASASASAAYRVRFEHVSASLNGLSVLPMTVADGLLTTGDSSASSFRDQIPDSWRLRYFGSTWDWFSRAEADADGDGDSNWAEFLAGTNPTDANSRFRARASTPSDPARANEITLRWPSVKGKVYSIEAARGIPASFWVPLAGDLTGTGHEMEFTVPPLSEPAQFFRIRLVR